jgi:hypothetical protein
MMTHNVHFCALNTHVGGSQLAAESLGMWKVMGSLTMKCKCNKESDCVLENAHFVGISNKLPTSPFRWDLLIDYYIS